eukprot:TRINITY_DN8374_c0_g1_i5.p1 TRINITY_DN8374_c0_g1~~TRINITY_DN8374_c0_g1_i5.p1  ORF type:complete len:113 (+),score=25.27 TRINITY_DN8374_c0_g1_i5:30-341(+)
MACNTCDATQVQGRRFFVGGNWKLNGSKESIKELVGAWKEQNVDKSVEIVIAPPAVYLDFLRQELPDNYSTAAQNVHKAAKGAFTGENRSVADRQRAIHGRQG